MPTTQHYSILKLCSLRLLVTQLLYAERVYLSFSVWKNMAMLTLNRQASRLTSSRCFKGWQLKTSKHIFLAQVFFLSRSHTSEAASTNFDNDCICKKKFHKICTGVAFGKWVRLLLWPHLIMITTGQSHGSMWRAVDLWKARELKPEVVGQCTLDKQLTRLVLLRAIKPT